MADLPRSRLVLPAILLVGIVFSFHDVLFLGRTLLSTNFVEGTDPSGIGSWEYEGRRPGDIPVMDAAGPTWVHETDARLAREMILDGDLPLWNPHTAGGMPFLAGMVSALLYPLQWVLNITDAPWMWDLFMIARLLLAGLLGALYLRTMGIGRAGAALGGYGYMMCGFHVWNINLFYVNASLLLPLVLYATERHVRSPSGRSIAVLAGTVALSVLSGAAEPAAFVLLCGLGYGIFRLVTGGKGAGGAALAIILGMGASAPIWIPFLEWLPISDHLHGSELGQISMSPGELPRLVAPDFLGGIFRRWDGSVFFYDPGYAGAIVVILAVLACLGGAAWRRPWVFFAGTAIFCILTIYGFPGVHDLVSRLPVFDRAFTSRLLGPVLHFSLCALAAVATDRIATGEGGRLRYAASGVLMALGVTLVAAWGHPSLLGALVPPAILCAIVMVLAELRLGAATLGWALVGLLAVEMFILVPRDRADRADPFREPPYVEWLQGVQYEPFRVIGTSGILHPNMPAAYRLDGAGGHYPIFVGRYMDWMREVVGVEHPYIVKGDTIPDLDHAGLDMLNVKYIVTPPGTDPGSRRVVYDQEVRILENPDVLPRAYVVPRAEWVQTPEEARARIRDPGFDPKRTVVLEGPPREPEKGGFLSQHTIRFESFRPGRVQLDVLLHDPGYLVLTDTYFPGWRVETDGEPGTIYPANGLFRAVHLEPGSCVVEFSYVPKSVILGAALGILSLAAMASLVILRRGL